MQIHFRTKEESNRIQQEAFLKLAPVDRFYAFLDLMYAMKDFPSKEKNKNKGNFVIKLYKD
jgi:hypothetical protein